MRLLVITHTFPPSGHSNAKRPFYLVRGFLQAGWEVDVYTSPIAMKSGAAEMLLDPRLRIFRIVDPIDRVKQRFAQHGRLFRWVSLGISGVMWPDVWSVWSRRVLNRIRGEVHAYDRVVAFVFPSSVLLSGLIPGLVDWRWIFDMQESVTPQFKDLPRRSLLNKLMMPRLESLEKKALKKAGRIVFSAATNRDRYIAEGLVDAEKTAHFPYFFDAEVFSRKAERIMDGFAIYYFGMFDWRGSRSPNVFLRSLAKFLAETPEARRETRFVFHGRGLREHDSIVEEYGLEDVVEIKGLIGPQDYLEKLKRCPVLLLVVSAGHNLFMPSKIVDYFGAQRPILSFVPRDSEMRRVLEDARMAEFACDEFDVDGGARALGRLWQKYRASELKVDGQNTDRWSSSVQVPKYIEGVRCLEGPEGPDA